MPRFTDKKLQEFYDEFHALRVEVRKQLDRQFEHEKEWCALLAALMKSVDEIKAQMPEINEVVTRWSQARGIFWFVAISALAVTGMVNIWQWAIDHLKRFTGA